MALGSILAIGALALLGIGGAVVVVELLRRRDSVAAGAEAALSKGVRDALGDVVGRLLPTGGGALPGLPGLGLSTRPAGNDGLSQVTGVLSTVGGIAGGLGSLIGSIGGLANAFGSTGGGGGVGGGLAAGASSVFTGGASPASAFDRDVAVIDFGPDGGGLLSGG